jgi:hypothetical protein
MANHEKHRPTKRVIALLIIAAAIVAWFHAGQPVSASRGDVESSSRGACLVKEDGTKDCTPAFIQVGEPYQAATLSAVSCSGKGCDGKNPYSSGCAVNYGVVAMNYIYDNQGRQVGYTQLWWSNTCQTNWARTVQTWNSSWTWIITAHVTRDDNRNGVADYPDTSYWATVPNGSSAKEIVTGMVYSPTLPARACGYFGVYETVTYRACSSWR